MHFDNRAGMLVFEIYIQYIIYTRQNKDTKDQRCILGVKSLGKSCQWEYYSYRILITSSKIYNKFHCGFEYCYILGFSEVMPAKQNYLDGERCNIANGIVKHYPRSVIQFTYKKNSERSHQTGTHIDIQDSR